MTQTADSAGNTAPGAPRAPSVFLSYATADRTAARALRDELRAVLIFDVWNPLLSLEERAIVQRIAAAERQFRLGAEAG